MTPTEFCYWLQGAIEMSGGDFDKGQLDMIVDKLDTVFKTDPVIPPAMQTLIDQIVPVLPPVTDKAPAEVKAAYDRIIGRYPTTPLNPVGIVSRQFDMFASLGRNVVDTALLPLREPRFPSLIAD